MKEKLKNKIVRISIFIFSLALLLGQLYVFFEHIDFFATRTLTFTREVSFKSALRDGKIGAFVKFTFKNTRENKIITKELFVDKDFYEEIKQEKTINIFYTRYFKQVLIKGYKNPRGLIILIDLIIMVLCFFGILVGFDTKTNHFPEQIEEKP